MSEASDRSDVSRSARAHTIAPGSTRRTATSDEGRPSPSQRRPLVVGTTTAPSNASELDQQQTPDLAADDSFSEERFMSSNPLNSSWEESHSFDGSEERPRPASRPSSRTSFRDRRKQFDTTTPTLIDEEEDSEMLTLEHSRIQQVSYGDQDDSLMRRTPGASMYKSSFEPTPEEVASMRKTPGASAMHKSAGQTSAASPAYTHQIVTVPEQKEPVGLGFGLTLSTPVGTSERQDQRKERQRNIGWEAPYGQQSHSSTPSASPARPTDFAAQESQIARPPLPPTQNASPAQSSQTQEPRGPFSFSAWGKNAGDEQAHQQTYNRGDGRSGSSGAYSPNILRLTEDIGNLLHEDEDDDFALEIPSVFRGDNIAGFGASSEDWTGSYVFDSDAGRRASKPAVPSRSTTSSNPLVQKERSRRRSSNSSSGNQQQYGGTAFLPNAQQPKPRMRSGNEVFEFGKSARADSPQVLNFGGAFAPPAVLMGNNPGFVRPTAGPPLHEAPTQPASQSFRDHQQQNIHHHHMGLQQGNFHLGIASNTSASAGPIDMHNFDAYQQQGNVTSGFGGGYFQQHQSLMYATDATGAAYGMSGAAYSAQQSEMQATAREFVPRTTFNPASQFQAQESQWRPQQIPTTTYDTSIDHASWHGANNSFRYASSYGYGGIVQPSNYGDPRASMTPSPHLPSWSQPQQTVQPPQQQGHQQPAHQQQAQQQQTQHQQAHQPHQQQAPPAQQATESILFYNSGTTANRSESVTSGSNAPYRPTSSPHPSIAGSEHSQGTTQRSKKDPKRKQRGKKKTLKSDSTGTGKKTATKKKNQKGDQLKGVSQQSVDGNEETQAAIEDPNDAKRTELIESPATRAAFKEFYRAVRSEERLSFQKAEEFALQSLEDGSLPESVHWRVYLELADLAKRSNRYMEARRLYKKVCQLQPYASQGWLEYSKLEEECGHMNRVMNILHSGLEYCKYSESLLTRAVKHQEKMGNLANARSLLARLKHVGIEKVWRTVLEGALLEARAGNVATARRVLKYLMHHVPWYGPLYLEAYRLEKDQGHPLDALQIVERGLQAIPRYGPLWFGAFRLCEEMDRAKKQYSLPQTMAMIERAAISISKELVWKVHLEAAQMLERSALEQGDVNDPSFDELLVPARRRLSLTILTCPNNLRWKVWLAAARMELGVGNTDRARLLFTRAHEVVPKKGRSSTLLESARLEDFIGDTDLARAILTKGRFVYGHDWKVWLESVLLEIRSGNSMRAVEICTNALEIHQGTGRLWATLVQLRQSSGRDEAQKYALRRALNAVPKSGEVWCEGGRIHLNPFSDTFDLKRARRDLHFATRFTPQYGDGFVESIRLELIDQWLSPIASYIWEKTKSSFRPSKDARVENSLTKYVTDVALAISVASLKDSEKEISKGSLPKLIHRNIVATVRKKLRPEVLRETINLSDLRLACVNADPNYGLLWFHCRRRPTDTPRRIIEDAAGDIAEELQKYAHIYLAAIIRREAVVSTIQSEKPAVLNEGLEITNPEAAKWDDYVDEKLQEAPSLEEIFNPIDPTTGLVLLENTINGPLFVTGLSELNKHKPISSMPLSDRRRILFGNDSLFP